MRATGPGPWRRGEFGAATSRQRNNIHPPAQSDSLFSCTQTPQFDWAPHLGGTAATGAAQLMRWGGRFETGGGRGAVRGVPWGAPRALPRQVREAIDRAPGARALRNQSHRQSSRSELLWALKSPNSSSFARSPKSTEFHDITESTNFVRCLGPTGANILALGHNNQPPPRHY
jgi:hypothetical protein